MAALVFSDQKPVCSGFYWVRHSSFSAGERDTVVHVYRSQRDGKTEPDTVFIDGENYTLNDSKFLMWAGPIQEPENIYPHYQKLLPRGW